MHIVERMCQQYGPTNKKTNEQGLFSKINKIDVMDIIWLWTENNPDIKSISMDSMRDWMGLSTENAHDALKDVKDTANILIRFMKFYRSMAPKTKFEKAFADGKLFV